MLVVAIIILGFMVLGGLWWLAVPLAIISGAMWLRWDVKRHPSVPCRICAGSGDHMSRLGGSGPFRRPFGDCRCCGGRKAHPRLAAIVLDPQGRRDAQDRIRKGRSRI